MLYEVITQHGGEEDRCAERPADADTDLGPPSRDTARGAHDIERERESDKRERNSDNFV